MSGVETVQFALRLDDGARLPATYWRPIGPVRAVAACLHSFGDYRRAYAALGPWLALRGVACLAFDQRGFGETRPFGRPAKLDRGVEDVAGALRWLRRRHSAAPRLVIGESLGGALAIVTAARKPNLVDAIAVASPAVRRNQPYRQTITATIAAAGRLAPAATLVVHRKCPFAAEAARLRLTADPRVVRRVRADALLTAMHVSNAATNAARAVRAASLVIYGGRDWLISAASVAALAEDLAGPVAVHRHPELPHLIFQCQRRFEVFEALNGWIEGVLARLTQDQEPGGRLLHWKSGQHAEVSL